METSMRLTRTIAILILFSSIASAGQGPTFSSLPKLEQYRIREMVEPPPPAKRHGCYSTPMYYLFREGYEYKGDYDVDPDHRIHADIQGYPLKGKRGPDYGYWKLDRNRMEWQEAVMRDWVELGLNNTHFNIYPDDDTLKLSPAYRKAIEDYAKLSARYGLKVGVRLDALGGATGWEMNPDNPNNRIKDYLPWAAEVARLLKGKTAYYVLGDEMTLHEKKPGLSPEEWTPEKYLAYFRQVSGTIKKVDPAARVSMFAASSGQWFNVLHLLKSGYARYGDGVTTNLNNYETVAQLFDEARKLAPGLLFLSNGVGYVSCAKAQPRYPEWDHYTKWPSEEAQGNEIAKHMFAWWDVGADTAPYYITLRNWVIHDKVYPHWFGFFGFTDFVIDQYDNLVVKRYPAWYAFQAVAHTFYNREEFRTPTFPASSSAKLTLFRSYEHKRPKGSEFLMMMWNDNKTVSTTISLGSKAYRYPVRISTFNYHAWSDVPCEITNNGVQIALEVGSNPIMIRMVASPDAGSETAKYQ